MSDPVNPGAPNTIHINADNALSEAAANLLRQIANSPAAVNNIQFAINLAPPTPPAPVLPAGVSVRQVFPDPQNNAVLKVRISFISEDPTKQEDPSVRNHDIGEKDDWERLLGDPQNVDIDSGIAILRIDEDGQGAVTTWLPNDITKKPIVFDLKQASPEPGDPVDLAAFLACMSEKTGNGKSYADALSACLNQLGA